MPPGARLLFMTANLEALFKECLSHEVVEH